MITNTHRACILFLTDTRLNDALIDFFPWIYMLTIKLLCTCCWYPWPGIPGRPCCCCCICCCCIGLNLWLLGNWPYWLSPPGCCGEYPGIPGGRLPWLSYIWPCKYIANILDKCVKNTFTVHEIINMLGIGITFSVPYTTSPSRHPLDTLFNWILTEEKPESSGHSGQMVMHTSQNPCYESCIPKTVCQTDLI